VTVTITNAGPEVAVDDVSADRQFELLAGFAPGEIQHHELLAQRTAQRGSQQEAQRGVDGFEQG